VIRLDEALNTSISLYRPDGSLLCASTSDQARHTLRCTLDSTATFTLLVGDTGGDVGSYELVVNRFLVMIPLVVH
jgi:hypothetical protein